MKTRYSLGGRAGVNDSFYRGFGVYFDVVTRSDALPVGYWYPLEILIYEPARP